MRKLGFTIIAVLALTLLSAPTALAAGKPADKGKPADQPAQCEETDAVDPTGRNGNDRCPENPPCDADAGRPGLKSPQCVVPPCTDTDEDGICDEDEECEANVTDPTNESCDEACEENGLDAFLGTPAEGVASGVIHDTVEPIAAGISPELGAGVHDVNCGVVVPVEEAVDDLLGTNQ